jgi:hypothetical protein
VIREHRLPVLSVKWSDKLMNRVGGETYYRTTGKDPFSMMREGSDPPQSL